MVESLQEFSFLVLKKFRVVVFELDFIELFIELPLLVLLLLFDDDLPEFGEFDIQNVKLLVQDILFLLVLFKNLLLLQEVSYIKVQLLSRNVPPALIFTA